MWQSVTTETEGVQSMKTRNVLIALMAIFGIVVGTAMAGIDYSKDIYGNGAPIITMVDPMGDQASVTSPTSYNGRVIFVDLFGRHVKEYDDVTIGAGETKTFDVPLADNIGHVGIYTDYYKMPVPAMLGGAPNTGSSNNAMLAQWNMVAYLGGNRPHQAGKTYQLAPNGAWVWNTKQ